MRNKIIIFIIIVLSIILIPNVFAFTLEDGKELEYGNQTYAYNWASSSTWTSLGLHRSGANPFYTDYVTTGTNGISFGQFYNGLILANHYYRLTWVASSGGGANCGSPASWDRQLRFGTGMGNDSLVTRSYTRLIGIQNDALVYIDDSSLPGNDICTYTVVFALNNNATFFNVPVNSATTLNNEWFYYGFYLEDIGSTDMVSNSDLQTAITNMQNSINSNSNTNTQNIINNQNNNAQQAHTDAQNMQNTIKDDNVDNPNSSINTIKNYLATNGVITNLVTLPVTLYQSILNSVNSSCATFSLGSLYGTNLQIPCINVANYIGNTLWGTIDVIISGIFVYSISRKMVKVFNQLSSMKEGDVLDG